MGNSHFERNNGQLYNINCVLIFIMCCVCKISGFNTWIEIRSVHISQRVFVSISFFFVWFLFFFTFFPAEFWSCLMHLTCVWQDRLCAIGVETSSLGFLLCAFPPLFFLLFFFFYLFILQDGHSTCLCSCASAIADEAGPNKPILM